MKTKTFTLIAIMMALALPALSQTYINLQDNTQVQSNAWLIINPNNYVLPDPGEDGILQISNQSDIIIDGNGVTVDGTNYQGYLVKIDNSHNITIKNFGLVNHYYYAAYITNSDSIFITNNDFSYNRVDSTGWIDVWSDYTQALGGGVMMYQCYGALIIANQMRYQNDGVALYHCDGIKVADNNFEWNTSYGIRMYFTDGCTILNNYSPHINRPYTNPSDCAAILLIISNNNTVMYNDFSHSGDGIFLGQFQYSQILNNNYFAYNECSYSPHNAIEATFADGNVYIKNKCNYSHYGFWLGYSFNSVVDSNEVIGNQYSGIAIDRGYSNTITHNIISHNPIGIELWEGSAIPPYQNQYSHDYFILDNLIEGDSVAISAKATENMKITGNQFPYNRDGIRFEGLSTGDTISGNSFKGTTFFHIDNRSPYDIYAPDNDFLFNDETLIGLKIFDKSDVSAYGEVTWHPFVPGQDPEYQTVVPADMAEPDAVWYAYPQICWSWILPDPTIVEWDYNEKLFGAASVHVTTGNGWDIAASYRAAGDSISWWSLTDNDSLIVWIKSANTNQYGFQFCYIFLGDYKGDYFRYKASAATILNPTIGQWKKIRMKLSGGSPWTRTTYGNVSLDSINWVEIHADTWGGGFELWLDGLTFTNLSTDITTAATPSPGITAILADPLSGRLTISYALDREATVTLRIFDLCGREIRKLADGIRSPGYHEASLAPGELHPGIYLCSLQAGTATVTKKFCWIK
jgi:parallel beta-helix repeat protein